MDQVRTEEGRHRSVNIEKIHKPVCNMDNTTIAYILGGIAALFAFGPYLLLPLGIDIGKKYRYCFAVAIALMVVSIVFTDFL